MSRLRAWIGAIIFIALVLVFIDYTGTVARSAGWLAAWQLVPAALALNVLVLAVLVAVTWIFGRVYCAVLCPLGVMQDGIWWIRRKCGGKKVRTATWKPRPWLRYGILALFVALLVFGGLGLVANTWAGLIEPYSAFGRVAAGVIAPASDKAVGVLGEALAARDYYYIFAPARVVGGAVMLVGAVTLLIVGVTAAVTGRGYCSAVCPVGSLLGLVSRHAWLRPTVDADKCVHCGRCARQCRSHCIDSVTGTIDAARCIMCLDCLDSCSSGAIHYTHPHKQKEGARPEIEEGRRGFLTVSGLALGAAIGRAADGGFAPLGEKRSPRRVTPVTPAGSGGIDRLSDVCTACSLCVSQCPQGILVPSATLERWMQPETDYTRGYCPVNCHQCGEVCPTGAIRLVGAPEKTAIQTGMAVVDLDTCLHCGLCAKKCPASAIEMTPGPDGKRIPYIDPAVCIGCGACEYYCPVGNLPDKSPATRSAIHVEGHRLHHSL